MLKIFGYRLKSQLYESDNSLVYRGRRISDERPVVLKILKDTHPSPERIAWFKREYEVIRNLTIPGVIDAYEFLQAFDHLIMVEEDFGGDSLALLKIAGQLDLLEFLTLAIKITEILGQIHGTNIIHKDINPSNIVFNPATGQVKIIDFGISAVLWRENPTWCSPNILEGTLTYISPEQTGRMNRGLDYRTDFYSLGVTLYELLTGILPFQSSDGLELIHSHIAKPPRPPHEIIKKQPASLLIPISEIIIKLMAKNALDRYQSAYGLKADLERCLSQLQMNGKIDIFPLGQQDISEQLQIPQKLYGREREIQTLLSAFERVAREDAKNVEKIEDNRKPSHHSQSKSEMILVAGYAGVGKSVLVREVHKPITAKRGNFLAGKFDQYQRNIPYYALSQAFNDWCYQLLTDSEAVLTEWREKILATIGKNGQVLIDVIPHLERVIGPQPPVIQVGPSEAQNRFNLVFQNFIKAICQPKHPLVLFIDDLQWADGASLNLLKTIMSDATIQCLLIIGAYRNNEVDATHPLMMTLEDIKKAQNILSFIEIDNLRVQDVNILISEALNSQPHLTQPLTNLVYEKTHGNAFFITEFLKSLYTEGLLNFDRQEQKWNWNISQIQAKEITDDVVELIAYKISKLPTLTQTRLHLAACIGSRFALNTLGIISKLQPTQVMANLFPALQENLIIPLNNKYKLIETEDKNFSPEIKFKFLHDRVQQAAYSLIDEKNQTATIHLEIGRLLLENTSPETLSDLLFEIVDHFNLGLLLVNSQDESNQIAKLNLLAGQKASAAMAYEAAIQYLNVGRQLLAEDSWNSQYDLTLNLYESAAYAAYLSTNYEQAEQLSNIVLQQAKTVREKANVYEIKIELYIAQNQMQAAIDIGLQFLQMLGIPLAQSLPTELEIEDLYNLPLMTDPDKLAAMLILKTFWSAVHTTNSSLAPSIIFTMVELSLNYGNSAYAAFAYVLYGLHLCRTQTNLDLGYQFGRLALKILDQFGASDIEGRVNLMFNCCIRPWKEHKRATLDPLKKTLKRLMETGDIEYASYAIINYCSNLFLVGEPLISVDQNYRKYLKLLQDIHQEFSLCYAKIWGQLVLKLRNQYTKSTRLIGEFFNESEMLPILQKNNNSQSLFIIDLATLKLNYLFGNYSLAIKSAKNAVINRQSLDGLLACSEHNFYYSLSLLANYFNEEEQQQQYLEQVAANQKEMKTWADHAPMNFQHNYDLVEAEKARILGQEIKAIKLYEQAIKGARDNEYIQEEALAYELAANFYFAQEMEELAQVYLTNAHYSYGCWGATAKVKDLEQEYSQFLANKSAKLSINRHTIATIVSKTTTDLDLTSVIKASHILSGEIALEALSTKMMTIVLENAGAEKGYLIFNKQGQWTIEASGTINNQYQILPPLPIKSENSIVSLGVINYVSRTQEILILNDAMYEGNFTKDPYIVKQQTKSLLCMPLLNHGQLSGFLYLENNQTPGVFTSDRLEILKLLTTQIVISIEKAELYKNLQAHSQELKLKNTKLLEANKQLKAEITERKKAEAQLLHNAFHDPLTGLPNRALFIERLERAIQRSKRYHNYLFAVLFLDLDRFKVINDSLGHVIGDQLLIALARRLEAYLRSSDTLARLGGDEFIVLLDGIAHSRDAIRIAERIQIELSAPFALGGQEIFITTSIGIALCQGNYHQPENLVRDADLAMYRAKHHGGARYQIFNASMHERALTQLQVEIDLRRGIERQEFLIYFQPIVKLETVQVIGFEALVRWQHPQRGLLSPANFVLIAEEAGLLSHIDRWVIGEACRQTRQWSEQILNNAPLFISVNIANKHFAQPNLPEQINQILQETGLNAELLKLEITENIIMENDQLAITKLEQLKALGVQLAIDDFGTGYSSLARLHHFPIDELKIDRSFINKINTDRGNLEITKTILTLAQKLDLNVTAEGIETPEQFAQLRELNCLYGQGYFFSRPLSTQAAQDFLLKV